MNNTLIPIYFDDILLTEEDYALHCHDFKIPYNELLSAIEQVRSKGEPLFSLFQSTVRERIRDWFNHVSLTGPDDESEALIVDGTQEAPETVTTNIVALDSQAFIQSTPKPSRKPKKAISKEYVCTFQPVGTHELDLTEKSTEPAPLAEQDEVTESAAIMLMQAMVGDSASFIITEEGICSINPAHPPSLVHSYQVVSSVLRLSDLSDKVNDKGCWMLGSILAALEDFHGENFNVGQVCEQTEKAENTIRTALSVFKAFKDKRYNLSFSSHKEGFHMKAPLEVKKLILHKAETYELTTKQIRALGSVYRAMDDDTTIRNIRSKQQALDLVSVVESVKVKWLAYEDGRMVELTRTDGSIPSGQMAINLKEKLFYINGEKAGEIERVGVKKFGNQG